MKVCVGCRRHVLHEEGACPFCGVRLRETSWSVVVGIVVATAGCGPVVDAGETAGTEAGSGVSTADAESSSSAATTGTSATTAVVTSLTTASTMDETTSLDTGDDAATSSASGGFIYGAPDGNSVTIECSVWDQDCPRGEKCMPWANDGGGIWNATRCAPVDADPAQVGEACIVEGAVGSGIDNCGVGVMCLGVDVDGTCVSLCGGSENEPTCADPTTTCSISNEGVLPLCLRTCDPLLQDCAEAEACVVIGDDFVCGPDASGPAGVFGDPCDDEPVQLPTLCDPGFACVDQSSVPGCAADGCCTAFCDLALGHEQCPGFAEGQQCLTAVPLGEQGKDGVGLCLIPA